MNSMIKITVRSEGTSSSQKKTKKKNKTKKKTLAIFPCPFIVYYLSKGMKLEIVWSLFETTVQEMRLIHLHA